MAPRVQQGGSSEGPRQNDGDRSFQFVLNDPPTKSIMNGNAKNKRIWGRGGKSSSVSSKSSAMIQPQGRTPSATSMYSSGSSMFDLSVTSADTSLSPLDYHRNCKIQKGCSVDALQSSFQESSGFIHNQVDDSCSLGQSTIATDLDESSYLDESISPTPQSNKNASPSAPASDISSPSEVKSHPPSRNPAPAQKKEQQPQCSTNNRCAVAVLAERILCGCIDISSAKDGSIAMKNV